MELRKENFSKADQEHVEKVAELALEGIDTSELSKAEYVELIVMLEYVALDNLYRRRYKNS
ncbi:hypothetical protein [uncultured Clostridium sp.]|uniref:hypothetical protein n=1 Tax=uncultured Clostridium sp. TaxID=59620 RepID=UPI00263817CF|nr:hypothetical protein [uncultured Clostridium sp.]